MLFHNLSISPPKRSFSFVTGSLYGSASQRGGRVSQLLSVDDAGTAVLAGLQPHCGDEPAVSGGVGVVVQRGAVGFARVFGVDDGRALVVNGPVPWQEVNLWLVAAPRVVLQRHHRLAVGGYRGNPGTVNLITVVPVRVVLHLRAEPEHTTQSIYHIDC